MELVSRDIFDRLEADVSNLAYVELDDLTTGVATRYVPTQDSDA